MRRLLASPVSRVSTADSRVEVVEGVVAATVCRPAVAGSAAVEWADAEVGCCLQIIVEVVKDLSEPPLVAHIGADGW